MKTRSGFVSNSSSSSFIIAFRKGEEFIDFTDMLYDLECSDHTEDTHSGSVGKREVVERFEEGWFNGNVNEVVDDKGQTYSDVYTNIFAVDEDDWEIMDFQLAYSDRSLRQIMAYAAKNGDLSILFQMNT